jgi:predicted amidophosphoribosyltransferase
MPGSLARGLLSLVVPPLCVACRDPELSGSPVCPDCRARLVRLPEPRCERCGAPVPRRVSACVECRGRALAFTSAWAPLAYDGVARLLVAALKSRGSLTAASFMAGEVACRAPGGLLTGTLVPVPAHPARRLREGFNQAAAIAHEIARDRPLGVADVLRRAGPSRAQVGLERRARLANARGSVRSARRPPEGPLVLVDDVYTTGATLDACAHALLAAGGGPVAAVTFARAIR